MDNWFKCSEVLPDNGKQLLLFKLQTGVVIEGYFDVQFKLFYIPTCGKDITFELWTVYEWKPVSEEERNKYL